MKLKGIFLRVSLIAFFAIFANGCALMKMIEHVSIKPPELEFRDYKVRSIDLDKITADLVFIADNPNKQKIEKFYVDYQFFIKEQLVAEGYATQINLIPEGVSKLTIPVDVTYKDLFNTAGILANHIKENQKNIDGRVHIVIYGDLTVVNWFGRAKTDFYAYQHDIKMDIPLPEINVKRIGSALKNRVNTALGFNLFNKDEETKPNEAGSNVVTESGQRSVVVEPTTEEPRYRQFDVDYSM